jgi:hypothetical protein
MEYGGSGAWSSLGGGGGGDGGGSENQRGGRSLAVELRQVVTRWEGRPHTHLIRSGYGMGEGLATRQ